jgi:hypothetical protein
MSSPTDIFTVQVAPALDEARAAIQGVGLRPHRVFMVIDQYTDSFYRKTDPLIDQTIAEVLPTPKVTFPTSAQIAHSGGMLQAGSCTLRKISRTLYTEAELLGKDAAGNALGKDLHFYYAIKPLGSDLAAFYYPDSDVVLLSTSYSLDLRPLNKKGVLAGITADP